jgi:hypothetical protein
LPFADSSPRQGAWIQTRSGRSFYPLDPRQEDVNIEDIACGLANQCRFTGQTVEFYSIAQHSVHASELVPEHLALATLLHDASEAYLVDVPSPLKRLPQFDFYRLAEDALMRVIYAKFEIDAHHEDPGIKEADQRMLVTEARDVMHSNDLAWLPEGVKPRVGRIQPWGPAEARSRFLARFRELASIRKKEKR